MSRNIRRLLFVVALFLASAASAQQSGPPAQSGNSRIDLDVVVTRKSGPPVSDLKQQDFTILDNKVPQTITSFQAVDGGQAPIEVVIVVDAVNADYHTVAYERDQIDKFLRTEGGDLAHSTSLSVLTDTGVQTLGDFSKDGNKLSASLDQYTVALRFLHRGAGFYAAAERFQVSLEGLHELVERAASPPGRKIMIWVSPGWPLLSGPEVQLDTKKQQQLFADIMDFSTDLLRDHITLYNIDPLGTGEGLGRALYWQSFVNGISKPSQVTAGNLGLQVLATQSGGLVFTASNNITALLQNCLADTRAYYELSFDPPTGERPNEYHHLEVRIAQHGLTARTHEGYYSRHELGWRPVIPTPVDAGNPRGTSP
jgi:VWFA-related protein